MSLAVAQVTNRISALEEVEVSEMQPPAAIVQVSSSIKSEQLMTMAALE